MLLAIEGLTKSYGSVEALRGIDLEVGAGQIVGLVGPNGAGKTSLVSIVAGLRRPDKGTVIVDGIDVARYPESVGSRLGLAPQELGVYVTLSVRHNVEYFAELAGLGRKESRRRAEETIETLGLTPLIDRRVESLSGGQKRRVHTAMALVHRPKLLLLDEPTAGADVESRNALLELVRKLASDGAAVCYSTHYLPEVETLDASVVIVDWGEVIARGGVQELVAAHARAAVELVFEGDAPRVPDGRPVDGEPNRLRFETPTPAVTAASILASLNSHAARVRSIELSQPGLEAVYLTLTGRRYRGETEMDTSPASASGPATEEPRHVPAP